MTTAFLVPLGLLLGGIIYLLCAASSIRRDGRRQKLVLAPAPPPMELNAPAPGPDQCPVCGVDDLHTRRVLNVPGGHAFTVPYGDHEAHYECAQTRPYVAEKLFVDGVGVVTRPAATVTTTSGTYAMPQSWLDSPDPAVIQHVLDVLGKTQAPKITGKLRDSVRNDVTTTHFTVDGHETFAFARCPSGTCDRTHPNRVCPGSPLCLCVTCWRARRDRELRERRVARALPPSGALGWKAWRQHGFTSRSVALEWYQEGYTPWGAKRHVDDGCLLPPRVPKNMDGCAGSMAAARLRLLRAAVR